MQTITFRGVILPTLAIVLIGSALAWALRMVREQARRSLAARDASAIERALLLGTLLLLLPMLPALNVNGFSSYDFLHARYMYLPIAGVAILVATGWHMAGKLRTVLLVAIALLLLAFVPIDRRLAHAWSDEMTLWSTFHAEEPRSWFVSVKLADQLYIGGRCVAALPLYQQVVEENAEAWAAWLRLGFCYKKLNDPTQAEHALERAATLSGDPRIRQAWQKLRQSMAR
jgi:tetratricopeptide (TPR) repeat protein